MFLLANLYMKILTQILSKRGVRKSLGLLPDGIDETVHEGLGQNMCAKTSSGHDWPQPVLDHPHTHSFRPIKVQERQYALAVEEGDEELHEEGLFEPPPLTSFCADLVVVDKGNNVLSLVHPTT